MNENTHTRPAPRGYDAVKALAKQRKQLIPDLIALSRQHDPFFSGSPADRTQAEWFAGLWQRFGYTDRVHLRRVHYQIFAQHDVCLPDGSRYDNDARCWDYLICASKSARYLGFIQPHHLIDQRNPDPYEHAEGRDRPNPDAWLDDFSLTTPSIPVWALGAIDCQLPQPHVAGYDYALADQPYHLEVWAEKSTMNDVLLPVCRELGANLVTSVGFQSITSAVNLLSRTARLGKPVRVFYVSDFDDAGWTMPSQVSRQVEYWLPHYAGEADIKLLPLVLTREQVDYYRLPNAPGSTKLGNVRFEAQQGRGVVELDALEALHPGELTQVVSNGLRPYIDHTLQARLAAARAEAAATAEAQWEDVIAPYRPALERITEEIRALGLPYARRLRAMRDEYDAEIAPLVAQLETVRHAVQEEVEGFAPDLPPRPAPERGQDAHDGWLFDTGRDYLTQLAAYKQRAARGEVAL